MIKSIKPLVFSFDIEWVPCPTAAERLCGIEDTGPESWPTAFKALWEAGGATEEMPQPFLKLAVCRIVSLCGILRDTTDKAAGTTLRLISLPADVTDTEQCTEAHILTQFLKAAGGRKPQLVGYNSAGSDVPIVAQRALAHGLPSYGFGARPDKPWEGVDYFSQNSDWHVDMGPLLGQYRNMPRLHEIATVSGIPGKMGTAGDNVAELWLEGDIPAIVAYNEFDAFTTHLLWARMAHFSGLLNEAAYAHEQQLVRELLESEIDSGKTHLQRYVERWDELNG